MEYAERIGETGELAGESPRGNRLGNGYPILAHRADACRSSADPAYRGGLLLPSDVVAGFAVGAVPR